MKTRRMMLKLMLLVIAICLLSLSAFAQSKPETIRDFERICSKELSDDNPIKYYCQAFLMIPDKNPLSTHNRNVPFFCTIRMSLFI